MSTIEHDEHASHLAHHFDTPVQQFNSSKLGIWIFLATEVLFFGGLFCAYSIYRANHPEIFIYAHKYLDVTLGGINTVVLICSSLTMAWAVRSAQLGHQRLLVPLLVVTLLCACGFLGIKYVEYRHKWHAGLLWARYYHPIHESEGGAHGGGAHGATSRATAPAATQVGDTGAAALVPESDRPTIAPAAIGPSGLAKAPQEKSGHGGNEPRNVGIFFSIYFGMTGLHGLHVLVGMGLITWLIIRSAKGHFGPDYFTPVDSVGLYWHLVDIIWIFLFPLLYLIH